MFSKLLTKSVRAFGGGAILIMGGIILTSSGWLQSGRPSSLGTAVITAGLVTQGVGVIAVVAGGLGMAKAPGDIEP